MPKKVKAPLPAAPTLNAEAWAQLKSLAGDQLSIEEFKIVASVAFLGIQARRAHELCKNHKGPGDLEEPLDLYAITSEATSVMLSHEPPPWGKGGMSAADIFVNTFTSYPDLVFKVLATLLGYSLKKRSKDFLERRDVLDTALFFADRHASDSAVADATSLGADPDRPFSTEGTKKRRRRRDKMVRDYAKAQQGQK